MKKILIITDVGIDSINGVATSLVNTKSILESTGFKVSVIDPSNFKTIPFPSDPEVRVALLTREQVGNILKKEKPDYVHIATEGTIGLAARMWCIKNRWKFTTSYCTNYPEYVQMRFKIKSSKHAAFAYLKWFHSAGQKIMVLSESSKKHLELKGFKNIVVWPFGVDTDLFKPNDQSQPSRMRGLTKPVFCFLGRVAPEKNIKDFLNLDLPGSKLIIGDGPQKLSLEKKFYGQAVFVGYKKGQELVDMLSASDVMVFPSKTDTLGIAILEALACGLPVAAFNVPGPADIINNGISGYLGDNLAENALKCLNLNPTNCRKKALEFSWEKSAQKFLENLVPI